MRPNFPSPLVTPDQLDALNFKPDVEKELGRPPDRAAYSADVRRRVYEYSSPGGPLLSTGYVCRSISRTREILSHEGKTDVAVRLPSASRFRPCGGWFPPLASYRVGTDVRRSTVTGEALAVRWLCR